MSHWGLFKWDVESVKALIETYIMGENRRSLRVIKYMLLEGDIRCNWGRLEELQETCRGIGISFETVRANGPGDEEN